ncbi:type IV secretion system DNA-binding domain-containing protein [Candidatus Parcubacteria bacterium]|nr:type IV secretion system DNA-binding domain-containing protein [Patescibacteria group bacterium]MBU4309281.1 type IV secretion system DNA-binding domain-containing protein [Patescibacteria group bacterium]MBU4432553.1 type IV secretion system DNA-binding domain-containing protein [Patescibacteria group bacterium]MBU4577642.1 type IV secretion system DNA-binding domain-containing protein [Patescibacteria group bacterium]MCG2697328.1 type IV secretion system DNA-binding domain-containing prote
MNKDIALFAETTYRNENRKFGIKRDDRRRHMYLIGKTGMGKSTIQENMIISDIRAGHGVAVVDPHGDLAEKIMEYIPNDRINDVVYFNPADYDFPIAFNIVEQVEPHLRHLVASGLIGVFQKLWADSWGPRLEYILRNAILAILDYPGSTLLGVTRILSDKNFRKKVVDNIQNPVVKAFWVNEFASYNDKFASEAVSPIQNKVGQFLSTSLIRNIIGQAKSTIDIRKIMDEGKILILNLSKGRIGEDNSQLLGSMIVTKIQLAAMSRVDMPESERRDFYLYVDEFQNFATDSFANILSEARKYRLNLILAHQYVEQLPEKVASAVFGNVGTIVAFRVGAADAEFLEPEFMPTFTAEDILNLPKYETYLKLMIDGVASDPFSARGLPPLSAEEKTGNFEKVIAISRERYAKPREIVEEKIAKWHNDEDDDDLPRQAKFVEAARNVDATKRPAPVNNFEKKTTAVPSNNFDKKPSTDRVSNFDKKPIAPELNSRPTAEIVRPSNTQTEEVRSSSNDDKNKVYKFDVSCNRCGKNTQTSFQPDGIRPIYCKECLSLVREEKNKEIEERRLQKERELKKLKETGRVEIKPIINVKEVSLGEALKMAPVNFGNRPKNNNQPKPVQSNRTIKEENLTVVSQTNRIVREEFPAATYQPKQVICEEVKSIVNHQNKVVQENPRPVITNNSKETDFGDDDEIDF